MAISFVADEVFEMAGEIERNGARFYRRAAESVNLPQVQQLFINLAEMENQHERLFAAMRDELIGQAWDKNLLDPLDEAAAYLHAYVSGRVFEIKADPLKLLAGKLTVGDILRLAIGFEKDSIVFYLGISELIPKAGDKAKVNTIIKEEMRHITFLSRELENNA